MSTLDHNQLQDILMQVIAVAEDASTAILDIYKTGFWIKQKEDKSPFTLADIESHKIISAGLTAITPTLPVLSEEAEPMAYSTRKQWNQYWLIDPLDGTSSFIAKKDQFTINIALIENHMPLLGLVHFPVSKTWYYAIKGQGAYKKNADGEAVPIATKKCDKNKILLTTNHARQNKPLQTFIAQLATTDLIKITGCLKFCLVAEGKVDLYPRFLPSSEWDTAAAQCILEAAGGRIIVDSGHAPLEYNQKESLLNPPFLVSGDRDFDYSQYIKNTENILNTSMENWLDNPR